MLIKSIPDYKALTASYEKVADRLEDTEAIEYHKKAIAILEKSAASDAGPMGDGFDIRLNRIGGFRVHSNEVTQLVSMIYGFPMAAVRAIIPSERSLEICARFPGSVDDWRIEYPYEFFDESSKDDEDYQKLWCSHVVKNSEHPDGMLHVWTCYIPDLEAKIEEYQKKSLI